MQFRVLGTLEVIDDNGQSIDLGGGQPRSILAMLLVAADRVVPADTIVERLWPERAPASATSTLQSYVSRLRKLLEPDTGRNAPPQTLLWESTGYRLRVAGEHTVDSVQFEQLADEGREFLAASELHQARATLADALALWRGPALQEFAEHPWARGVATRLDERRLAAIEDRIRADLLLGHHEVLVGELSDLIGQHPLREGLWEHQAVALYRSGRQAEALRALDGLRRTLLDTLGVDPSPRIRELETQILEHHPSLAAPVPATAGGDEQPAAIAPDDERASRHFAKLVTSELIGREAERRSLDEALAAAEQGRTQWVLIEGEPGIGKTRLMEHVAESASERGFDVLWGRSYESGATPSFWPWLGALRGAVEAARPLPAATQQLIDRLLTPASDEEFTPPVDASRFRLFEAIALLFERASKRRPLMIALDDLQWADPASLEQIEFMTGHVIGSRIMVTGTVRELEIGRNDAVVQALASVSRRPSMRRLVLRGVNRTDSTEIVRQAIGDASPAVIEAIHQRAEGNPFFIGELSRLLAAETDLSEAQVVRRAGVPVGVRDVVHRRLGSVPAATAELIQMMATIGRETHLGLLSRAAGVTMDRCIDDIDPALVNRLVVELPDAPGVVKFSHALVREVVLADLSLLRRARLHLRVADAMEQGGRLLSDDEAELFAEHLWQAVSLGVEARAATALERAAEVALRRFAYEAADHLLERALQLRQSLPTDRADLDAELDAMQRLTAVRRVRFGFEHARANLPLERAKQLARKTGRELVLTELIWTEWAGAATSCDFETAVRLAQELLDLGEISDNPHVTASGHAAWGTQCWHLGRITEAMDSADRAVAILDGTDLIGDVNESPAGPLGGLHENLMLARGFHPLFHELGGRPVPGGSPLPALASRINDPYVRLVLWVCESVRAVVGGDIDAGRIATRQATEIEVGGSFEFFSAGAQCLLGCIEIEDGDIEAGLERVRTGITAYSSVGVRTVTPLYMTAASYGSLRLGDIDAAADWIGQAEQLISETGELWELPFVIALRAMVMHASGAGRDDVSARFRDAHAVAVGQGALGSARRVVERAAEIGFTLE